MVEGSPIRMGILGAAQIAPMALIKPARETPNVMVTTIAARDRGKARAFAGKHAIAVVHGSYDELLADPEIDAVYNPLPNSLHCKWTVRALEAGKHVLCEKPIAANAEEAKRMAEAATRSGRVLAEAFHWRYHPLAARIKEIVNSGELGQVRHIEATFYIPLLKKGDIRYRYELGGGATMDTGCYTINIVRWLAGAEPDVVGAHARKSSPDVDRWMHADLRFADGRTGAINCSLICTTLLKAQAKVIGDGGEMTVTNPIAPHFYHRLRVNTGGGTRVEKIPGDATYTYQLRAFADWVRGGPPMSSDAQDAVANMRVIDAIYDHAGMKRRGLSTL